MADVHSNSQKRVVFGKSPKVPGEPSFVQVNASSEENSVNGGISAGGNYSKRSSEQHRLLAHQQPSWTGRNDSQP